MAGLFPFGICLMLLFNVSDFCARRQQGVGRRVMDRTFHVNDAELRRLHAARHAVSVAREDGRVVIRLLRETREWRIRTFTTVASRSFVGTDTQAAALALEEMRTEAQTLDAAALQDR